MRTSWRFRAWLLCCSWVAILACGDDQPPVSPGPTAGSLFVTVYNRSLGVVASATVITNPRTERRSTDALGQVLIQNVESGLYTLVASHPSSGSGQTVVTVSAGAVASADIHLNPAVHLEPQVDILSPSHAAPHSYVDSLLLRGNVDDINEGPSDLALQWRSSTDGLLSSAPASSMGETVVRRGPLGVGERWISLTATDHEGFVGADSVQLSVRSFAPEITAFQPTGNPLYAPGEPVVFSARVTDRETPGTALQATWSSSLDGVLGSGPPADGATGLTTSALSRGIHEIILSVIDSDQNAAAETVTVRNNQPQKVVLQPLQKDAQGVILAWPQIVEPTFASFKIQRSFSSRGTFQVIGTLTDPEAAGYRDESAQEGVTYWYRVAVSTTDGAESLSNVQNITAGVYIDVATQVEAMIVDPLRPYLYALDKPSNALVFVNLDTRTVEKSIFVGSGPSDLDIDASGNELFIANQGSSEIAVVDLVNRVKSRSLFVDTGGSWNGNPYRLVCATQGRLVWTGLDQWNSLYLIDTDSGVRLQIIGSIYAPELVANSDGTRIFAGEAGSSGSHIYRFALANDNLTQVDRSPGYGYSYPQRSLTMSGDGTYVFYAAHKLLANNLATDLGGYSEGIIASNQDGSVVVGQTKVFDGNTFGVLWPLPRTGTVLALSPDSRTLYLYDSSSSRIYLYDMTRQ